MNRILFTLADDYYVHVSFIKMRSILSNTVNVNTVNEMNTIKYKKL